LLARHLTRLSETLETISERLREAVSAAVGEAVAGIVRETIRSVLADRPTVLTSSERYAPSPGQRRPLWTRPHEMDEEPWFDDPDGYPPDDYNEAAPPAPRDDTTSAPSRLTRSIAVGFQTTLCWLRGRVGRFPVLTAISVGLLTALATYLGGPLAAAAVGLAGSAFGLLSLAEWVRTSADTLATFGNP
jgi:hypothetical protein